MLDYSISSTYAPPDPRLVEQWRRKLTQRDIRLVESKVGPMLTKAGYENSGLPAIGDLRPDARIRFNFDHRLRRMLFRLKRYGAGLTIFDIIARATRSRMLIERARYEINAVNDRYLK